MYSQNDYHKMNRQLRDLDGNWLGTQHLYH